MTSELRQNGDEEKALPNAFSSELKDISASKKIDNEILQALVKNPVVQSLAKAHTAMSEQKIQPSSTNSSELSNRIIEFIDELITEDDDCQDLMKILRKPHFMKLLKCHDTVAIKNRANVEQLHGTATNTKGHNDSADLGKNSRLPKAIRMVGLYKKSWEPLGLTVAKEEGRLKVARILHGSEIERKGLLHVDDIIMEVNGNTLDGDPKRLQDYLLKTCGSIVFKILPSYEENLPPKLLYIKCHINYEPKSDLYIPCVEAGLEFSRGDILQVVDQTDHDWWQAQRVNNKGEARGRAGLIPSQSFEEKRRAVSEMKTKTLSVKKKSRKRKSLKTMYNASQNSAFDKHDIAVYEEVACIPPFSRKTLVILTQGQTLADEICQNISEKNAEVYERPDDGNLEVSLLNGSRTNNSDELHSEQSLYCPQLNSVRNIMKDGKTCVLNATPQCLKLLSTSEFMPYVVFVKSTETAEPEEKVFKMSNEVIEKYYMQYIDIVMETDPNELTQAALNITEKMEKLKLKHQWVPTSWVY